MPHDSTGQAGALSQEVEITPAMIEAGVFALDEFRGAADDFELVKLVYTAMVLRTPFDASRR